MSPIQKRQNQGRHAGLTHRIRLLPHRFLQNYAIPIYLLLSVFILMLATLPAGSAQAAPPAQGPDVPPSVTGGQALWGENCLPCHGPAGQGDGPTAETIPNPPANLTEAEAARQRVPAETFDVIKNGRMENFMPPWGNRFSDEQIWDLVAHVWNLSTNSQTLAAGEAIYQTRCADCHGEVGTGDGPEAPVEINDFTDLQAMVRQSQADLRINYLASDAHAELTDLTEEEVWQVLDYVRTFSFVVPQRNGVLRGQVINATTEEPQGNIEVTLRAFAGNTEVESLSAQADEAGNFIFENLATDHSTLYILEGRYQDITYTSAEPGIFVPDSNETTLNLNVYEPTTEASAIDITQMHYLVSFRPNAMDVVQIFVVGNDGNRTYVGQDGQTFAFSLPDDARNIAFQNDPGGLRFVETGAGYVDTEPIVPGDEGASVVASYSIPIDNHSLTVDIPLPADVAALNVLIQEQGADLTSPQLQFVETRQVQGDSFSIYNGDSLSQDESVTLELSNLDQLEFAALPDDAPPSAAVAETPVDQNLLRWIIIGLVGLAVIATGVVYPQLRPRLTPQTDAHDDDPNLRRQKLLMLLARLDQVFEAGELDEAVYRRARAKYKTELAELMYS